MDKTVLQHSCKYDRGRVATREIGGTDTQTVHGNIYELPEVGSALHTDERGGHYDAEMIYVRRTLSHASGE